MAKLITSEVISVATSLVTSIEVQGKNKERVNVFLDGTYGFSCNAEVIYKLNLKKGSIVEEEYIKEIVKEDDYFRAKNVALKSMERSYKCEKEVQNNLSKRGFDEGIIIRVIEFLKSYSFVNDYSFVENFVASNLKTIGKNKIKYYLLKKGIDENIVNESLTVINDISEEENALRLAQKKLNSLLNLGKDKNKIYKSLGDTLMRNGYDFEIVKSVLAKVMDYNVEDNSNLHVSEDKNVNDIEAIAEKRYSIMIKSENDKRKLNKKLVDYLMRKGFTWEEIRPVVDKIINS